MKPFLLSLFLILSGCTFKSIVVPNLPYLIADRIDGKLHLYNEQEYEVRDELKKLFKEEIPRIQNIQEYVNSIDIKVLDEKKAYLFLAENYKSIAGKVNKTLANQFSQLDKNQIKKFKASVQEDNSKIEKRLKESKPKDYYKRFSFFFGELTESQKKMINSFIPHFELQTRIRINERREFQKKLFEYLKSGEELSKKKLILELFNKNADRTKISPERIKTIDFFDRFTRTLTPNQISFFNKKRGEVNSWLEAFLDHFKPSE